MAGKSFSKLWNATQSQVEHMWKENQNTLKPIHSPIGMTLEEVPTNELRLKTLQMLLTVPTVDIQTAFGTLGAFNDNVEVACYYIIDKQQMNSSKGLCLNEFIDATTKANVNRLNTRFPAATLQVCYVAVRHSKGVLDEAIRFLNKLEQAGELVRHGGQLQFNIDPKWMSRVEW